MWAHLCVCVCVCVQDLPLSYLFAYVVSGVETPLSASSQADQTLGGVMLPAGEIGSNTVHLVVYVRDVFGTQARCAYGANASVAVDVTSSPPVLQGSLVEAVQTLQGSTISDALLSGRASSVVSSVGLFASLLSVANPCASVNCGSHGQCFNGTCFCDAASGYTGTTCNIAPVPVDGVWGPWLPSGTCSVSCGGGTQLSVRTCTPPLYGGAPCDGNKTQLSVCNTQACATTIDGNWSEWSNWTECSTSCPGNVAGYYPGVQTRTRACNNPTPSADGLQCAGLSEDTRKPRCVFGREVNM